MSINISSSSPWSALVLTLLFAFLSLSQANLMGVDLGLGYIKVAVARPGKGLELVTNEQSKRKTPAAVGFTDEGERLFGDAAVAYAAKAPHRAILDGRSLIGQCSSEHSSSSLDVTPFCARDRLELEGVGKFTGEEVVAMLLAMAKRQASAALGGAKIKDVAITVPAWYDERQRLAVSDAARVIGLNCLGIVNANTAAALKYALDGKAKPTEEAIAAEKEKDKKKRTPKAMTQRVLFYDIGAGSASASVAEVTSDVKTGVANNVKMLSHAWEKGVGGRQLDSVVVERLANAFDKQRSPDATPSRDLPRVMMRLRKEAQRVREVLSANTDALVSVASLYEDLDLKTTLNRADFEADAKYMFDLVSGPAKAAINEAGLVSSDLDAVVPFGGTSRTPKVQQVLRETLGIEFLNKSINTDEAAVMGSAFFGASLSSTFRVRKLDFEDIYGRSISTEIEKEVKSRSLFSASGKPSTQAVDLFPSGSARMPSKKTLSLNRKNDFGLELYLGADKTGKARFPDRTLYAKIQIMGVSDVLKKLKDPSKAKTVTPRVALTFHVDRSGMIRIGTAESSIDETVVVEREIEIVEENKQKTEESQPDESSNGKKSKEKESEKAGSPNRSEATAEPAFSSEPEATDKKNAKDDSQSNDDMQNEKDQKEQQKNKKKTRIEKSTQTVVHRQTLKIKFAEEEGLFGMQMSGKELEAAQKVLKDLEAADRERVERANALNTLEGFILEVRSRVRGVDEEDDLYKVSSVEEREALVQAFDEGEDWMYTEEAKATANLREKHAELQKLYEPIESRATELSRRPGAFRGLVQAADVGIEETIKLRELHAARGSKHLEILDEFIAFCNSLKTWVLEKNEVQAKQPLTEAPVVTVKEVMNKALELKAKAEKVAKLEPPPAPTASPDGHPNGAPKDAEAQTDDGTNSTSSPGKEDSGEDSTDVPPDPNAESAKADAGSGTTKDEL